MFSTENLSYSYSESFQLEAINLQFEAGKIVGIIGHSGSGKSTLLHLLAGLKEPDKGKVILEGKAIKTPAYKLVPGHEKIKLVTQQNSLFPNITAKENIAYELRYYTKEYQQQRVEELAKALNLKHLLHKLPRELSGGEVQRVMIAKALADEPRVLLLDEPMANLDRLHKKQVMLSLQHIIEKENLVCIMVTHDIYDALGMAQELIIMQQGKVIQQGSSEMIYEKPKNAYVAALTGEINTFYQGDKSYVFRVEYARIDEAGQWAGKVKASIFQGAYYEIILQVEQEAITLRHPQALLPESDIKFSIDKLIDFN